VSLPQAPLHVETAAGAEIWIDNQLVGSAPLAAIEVPIGAHEVMVKHPDMGDRRESIDVRYGETAQIRLDLAGAPQP
jgi:hypothetical protein